MAKKEASIETELDEVMQKFYDKYVPAPVREYIESREADDQPEPQDHPARQRHKKMNQRTSNKRRKK